MRRAIDVVVAGAALLVLSPVLALLGLAVRLQSRGPALFRQERLGHNGVPFEIVKFRTMAATPVGSAPAVTAAGDNRITKVGQILRSTKIDELPQLINVVRGEMSLVGPRPEVARYGAHWTDEQRSTILSVRPGITDPASIAFRREAELLGEQDNPEEFYIAEILPQKAAIYVDYVHNRTLRGDLKLLLVTIRAVAVD